VVLPVPKGAVSAPRDAVVGWGWEPATAREGREGEREAGRQGRERGV